MSEGEMTNLQHSIAHWGMAQPLVVRRQHATIVAGHRRLQAAMALGLSEVPVIWVDVSEQEAEILGIALNRIAGEWDLPKLGEVLAKLQALPDLDVSLTGFGEAEIDSLLATLERESAPDPREESFPAAAEALQDWMEQAPTRASKGEVWRLGRHRLLCGDSLAGGTLERLCQGKVDVALTDPPYGIGYQSSLPAAGRRKRKIANDESSGFEAFLDRALPAIKGQMKKGSTLYWFASGGGPSSALAKAILAVERHFDLLNVLCWDRVDAGLGWRFRRSWEAIVEASVGRPSVWHGGRERSNVLRYPRVIPQSGDHPTPKPVPLLEDIIRCAAPARGLVLDCFAGSGSTLIAAERTGRTCFAAELEPRYCDIIVARWEALTEASATRA
jgi:DNA modification methylase